MSYRDISRYNKAYKKYNLDRYSDYYDGLDDPIFDPVEEVLPEEYIHEFDEDIDTPIFDPVEEVLPEVYDHLLDASAPPMEYTQQQKQHFVKVNKPNYKLTKEDIDQINSVFNEIVVDSRMRKKRPHPVVSGARLASGLVMGNNPQVADSGLDLLQDISDYKDYLDRPEEVAPQYVQHNFRDINRPHTQEELDQGMNPDGSWNYGNYSSFEPPDPKRFVFMDGYWVNRKDLTDVVYTSSGQYKVPKGKSNWMDVAVNTKLNLDEFKKNKHDPRFSPIKDKGDDDMSIDDSISFRDDYTPVEFPPLDEDEMRQYYPEDNYNKQVLSRYRFKKDHDVEGHAGNLTSQGKIIFTGRDFVCDVNSSTSLTLISTGTNINIFEFPINPGLVASGFTYLSNIAQQFQSYRFNKIRYYYYSTCGDAVGTSIDNKLGRVIMAYDVDPNAATFVSVNQMQNDYSAVVFSPASDQFIDLKLPHHERLFVRINTIVSDDSANVDKRNTDTGNFYIATVGCPANSVIIGQLYVEYEVELYQSILTGYSLGQNHLFSLRKLASQSGTLSSYFPSPTNGVYGGTIIAESLPLTFPDAGTCKFPLNVTGCEFYVHWRYSAGTITGSALNVSTTGLTLLPFYQSSTSESDGPIRLFSEGSFGVTSKGSINIQFACRVNQSDSKFVISSAIEAIKTPFYGGELVINQLPSVFDGFESAS